MMCDKNVQNEVSKCHSTLKKVKETSFIGLPKAAAANQIADICKTANKLITSSDVDAPFGADKFRAFIVSLVLTGAHKLLNRLIPVEDIIKWTKVLVLSTILNEQALFIDHNNTLNIIDLRYKTRWCAADNTESVKRKPAVQEPLAESWHTDADRSAYKWYVIRITRMWVVKNCKISSVLRSGGYPLDDERTYYFYDYPYTRIMVEGMHYVLLPEIYEILKSSYPGIGAFLAEYVENNVEQSEDVAVIAKIISSTPS